MEKRWVIKERADAQDVEHIATVLNVDKIVANLLVQRGIKTYDEAKSFFRPDLANLHDPFLMKDMDKAVGRLTAAIENKEKILIYGDYDVDGTTSVAMMYSFLKNRLPEVLYYIPDRDTEGYGLSMKGIDYAFENGCKLIIALDCGIKANEKVDYANAMDIDIIICDHHNPGETLPDAAAILDPKQPGCEYPYKDLSGCGVGFKLLQAYAQSQELPKHQDYQVAEELIPYLDLVAVSIASDIVPIFGENRILAYYGLKQINENPRIGLRSVMEVAGIEKKQVEINDIVFKIGPRINAAGRIESGQRSVDLLIAEEKEDAERISLEVNEYNITRQNIDQQITEEALAIIAADKNLINRKSTVLFKSDWHKGVVGIVASRVIETYYRPTIILTESNGNATGSARSVPGFDIYHAIERCSDLLISFGGHTYAAGLTMKMENLELFSQRFEEIVSESIEPEALVQQIRADARLRLDSITPRLYRILKQFSPFGPENMKPVFVTEKVIDRGTGRIVGKDREHLKLDLKENIDAKRYYPAIAFKQADHYEDIKYRKRFDICYSVEENEFMGNTTLQIKVRDMKPRD